MIRTLLQEAARLAAVGLFVAMVGVVAGLITGSL
ncbi:hypothetical protein FHS55_002159 [Angulomicrobium tetraedrale]|uniref:Uncharacterized protein n=1 Tax=Ancylobacter tetraedralis TaxID=217068 RepID=A0A839Z9Z2_9HYPH|nr:hypothetical protein [Ancylobacter tetraedralis]